MEQSSPKVQAPNSTQIPIENVYSKRTFELANSLGKLMVQVNSFNKYFFIIVTYASLLKVDGTLQISYPTPYDSKPIVLNLIQEDNGSDDVTRRLSAQLGVPVILSLNIEFQTNKKGEQELSQGLLKICKAFTQPK